MASKRYAEKYTRPDLREKLKEEIKASDKGGKKGQWSARKSQMLVQEYERKGGGYKGDKDERQRSLEEWTAEDWQTISGSADAARGQEMHRYLPAKAWALLTESERKKAQRTKIKEDDRGRQYAEWPAPVRRVMTLLGKTGDAPDSLTKDELQRYARRLDIPGRSSMNKSELIQAIQKHDADASGPIESYSKQELYEEAKKKEIEGRSRMNKQELIEALKRDGS